MTLPSAYSLLRSSNLTALPTDPLFDQQWYLQNTGQTGGLPGMDLRVTGVWTDYTGKGVRVGIIDDGIQYIHPDLAPNYDLTIDADVDEADNDPAPGIYDFHGTAVAGIIAAAHNDQGGVGVAPEATIAMIRMGFPSNFSTDDQEIDALARMSQFDVVNNSWGYPYPFIDNFSDPFFADRQPGIQDAVTQGRNGRGTVVVFAAGNGREEGDNSNYHNLTNSRQVIAVAALNHNGVHPYYSSPGANLLVSAFGGGSPSPPTDFEDISSDGIVTTDRLGLPGYNLWVDPAAAADYTNHFDGTSAAAPMVSGVVALMLEANPRLGYRDVQEILAYSARQNNAIYTGWKPNGATNWNGGGLHVSHDYGFGVVDAHAAVRLAETWSTERTAANEQVLQLSRSPNLDIPDGTDAATDQITMPLGLEIDFIEVDLSLTHAWIGDLEVTLTSPDGTTSVLLDRPGVTQFDRLGLDQSNLSFTFSSTHHWGERGVGEWVLTVRDRMPRERGTLDSWALRLYGDRPTNNNTYIYTDEFATVALDPDRSQLIDSAGDDTLNAAAVTSNVKLNLAPGSNSSLAGNTLEMGTNTVIERAFTGDGEDSLTGNAVANELSGGRGADRLNSAGGNDRLFGEQGTDSLAGGNGADELVGAAGNDQLTGGGGSDRFRYATGRAFQAADLGIDTISDFTPGSDLLELSHRTFAALTRTSGGSLVASEFATVATDAAVARSTAFVVYSLASGRVFYNPNGDRAGLGTGAHWLTLTGQPALTAANIRVVA